MRSVQLVDEPPNPCTKTAGAASPPGPVVAPGIAAVRTKISPSSSLTNSPGHTGMGSATYRLPPGEHSVDRVYCSLRLNNLAFT
jgi:hypothetical protein